MERGLNLCNLMVIGGGGASGGGLAEKIVVPTGVNYYAFVNSTTTYYTLSTSDTDAPEVYYYNNGVLTLWTPTGEESFVIAEGALVYDDGEGNTTSYTYTEADNLDITTITLANNTIFNASTLEELDIVGPTAPTAAFMSQVNFTSGATATTFAAPDTMVFMGDDCSAGAFTPAASTRYVVIFMYDGTLMRANVQGVATT